MKRILQTVALVVFAGGNFFAQEPARPASISSSITAVTVYVDRARVTRKAQVDLKQGSQVLEFGALPGWIDPESIRFSLQPADVGRIVDVQVSREYLAQAGDKEVQKAEAAVREAADLMAALDDELKVLAQQAKQIEDIKAFSMEKLPRDIAVPNVSIETYGKVVDFVAESLRRNAIARRDSERKRRDVQPEFEARQRKLNDLRNLAQLTQTLIRIAVDCPAARKADISLTYMLPGATWEPVHELRALGRVPEKVEFLSFAVVTQTTGEDWNEADISFSTQSPEQTIHIPEVSALLLDSRVVSQLAGGGRDSFAQAQELYKGQNLFWYSRNKSDTDRQNYCVNNLRQIDTQTRNYVIFQKLQGRGTTVHFQGRTRPAVRQDGRSVRVPIGETVLTPVHRIVAAPEVSLNAANILQMTNTCAQAFLPGKVSLYHEGAFLGLTDLDFVSADESFSVFLGVADQIKLSRVLDRKHSSLVRGRRTRMQISFDGCVENLSKVPVKITLTDRIPVSQHKEIRVFDVSTKPDVDPDSKGIVKWELNLKAGQKFPYRVEYTIEYPPEEIERMLKATDQSAAPAAEMDHLKIIKSLEAAF